MPSPETNEAFLELLDKSGLVTPQRFHPYRTELLEANGVPLTPQRLAVRMVRRGLLTNFQAKQLLRGRHRDFILGRYRLLEPIWTHSLEKAFLAEDIGNLHRVVLQILSTQEMPVVDRLAAVTTWPDHPNLVRMCELGTSGSRRFLVLDFVEGMTLFHLVRQSGPIGAAAAAQYTAQVAAGLYRWNAARLTRASVSPSKLLIDRFGTVKVIDLVSGDGRHEIQRLGAVCFFLLTGRLPWQSKPLAELRSELPEQLTEVVNRMLNASPTMVSPRDVVKALAPWSAPVVPPPDSTLFRSRPVNEMPHAAGKSGGSRPSIILRRSHLAPDSPTPLPRASSGVAPPFIDVRLAPRWPLVVGFVLLVLAVAIALARL